jgi:cyclopropane-fatty-acyl-phospholipid synthase
MWEFYLAGAEAAFRWQDLMVFQIQLTRGNAVLPITRDYMPAAEVAYRERERAEPGHEVDGARRRSISQPGKQA